MVGGLPVCHFGFPGPQRDQLVAAVLRGEKTATASLRLEYEPEGRDELPQPGMRWVVVHSSDRPVAVIETSEVRVVRAGDVDEQFAFDEGEIRVGCRLAGRTRALLGIGRLPPRGRRCGGRGRHDGRLLAVPSGPNRVKSGVGSADAMTTSHGSTSSP